MDKAIMLRKYAWMKVIDVMTEAPLTVTPSDTVGHAERLMSEHSIRQLPVVRGRELVGVITDRDIRSLHRVGILLDPECREEALEILVGRAMTRPPVTLSPNDGLEKALTALIDEKFGGFPVVDDNAGLLGIVTYIDLLRCFLNRLQED